MQQQPEGNHLAGMKWKQKGAGKSARLQETKRKPGDNKVQKRFVESVKSGRMG